ncbi:MAG: 6-pyruvoyl tetrahydropterin synthase family protein [Tepidisphaeraceae bacterium]
MHFEISVRRVFCASHQLRLPDGSLEPLHGHNWELTVTVAADKLDGMDCVMDFHDLEKQIDERLKPWQNAHLNDVEPFAGGKRNPSAERVAQAAAENLRLPSGVRLVRSEVTEAPGCVARFLP